MVLQASLVCIETLSAMQKAGEMGLGKYLAGSLR